LKKENHNRQVNLSCQGPITRNYNARELAEYFIPNGGLLFSQLQNYDRFLTEADDTALFHEVGRSFAWSLPFLKAFGATNTLIEEYSIVHVSLMPGVNTFFNYIRNTIPCFLISAGYEPFILSLCRLVGFPETNTYSTPINLDRYSINESERETLVDLADEIIKMPLPWEGKGEFSSENGNPELIAYGQRLKAIFTEEIPDMQIGEILNQTMVRAGIEKVGAIKDSLKRTGNSAKGVMYIGGSVLDVAAMDWIKRNGGLTVSFNGDKQALHVADIALIGGDSIILAILSDVFFRKGKEGIFEIISNWDLEKIPSQNFEVYRPLINQLFSQEMGSFPRIELITDSNREYLIDESKSFRQIIFQDQR